MVQAGVPEGWDAGGSCIIVRMLVIQCIGISFWGIATFWTVKYHSVCRNFIGHFSRRCPLSYVHLVRSFALLRHLLCHLSCHPPLYIVHRILRTDLRRGLDTAVC